MNLHSILGAMALIIFSCTPGNSVASDNDKIACQTKIAFGAADTQSALLIFGEMHGTRSAPEYFEQVVCAALLARKHGPIVVALEYPRAESVFLRSFLASNGAVNDRAKLLATPFWRRSMQDGRSSVGTLKLTENLRRLQRSAPQLAVELVDPVQDISMGPTRDEAMAAILSAVVKRAKGGLTLMLVGNLHAKRTPGFGGNPAYKTMASTLTVPFRTYAFVAKGGHFWACVPACGEQTLPGSDKYSDQPNFDLGDLLQSQNYDGLINLGIYELSPPAVGGAL